MTTNAIKSSRRFSPTHGITDAVLARKIESILASAIDQLAGDNVSAIDRTIRELLVALGYDAAELLAAVSQHYKRGRIEQPGADVPAEVAAAKRAFAALSAWATVISRTWSGEALAVSADAELVAERRLERALFRGMAALTSLLDLTLAAGTDEQRLALARLAEEAAPLPTTSEDARAAIAAYVRAARGQEIAAAFDLVAQLDAVAKSSLGFMEALVKSAVEQAGPPSAPEAA